MSTQLALASDTLSTRLGVEKAHMLATIKAQCFKGTSPDRVSDTQLAAYVQVAQALNLNPLLPGMLYAYPERGGGIQPIIGPDGVFKILAENPTVDSWECEVFPDDPAARPTHAIARIWVKGSQHPRTFTAYFEEWAIDSNPNWKTRPRHMIWTRALKQCARQVIHGIPFDGDEYAIAQRAGDVEPLNVTGTGEEASPAAPVERPKAPARRGSARAAAAEQSAAPAPVAPVTAVPVPVSPAPVPAEPPVREEREVSASQPVAPAVPPASPAVEAKPEPPPAQETKPATPKPPPIQDGIDIDGFFGAAWPLDLVMEIKEIKQLALTPAKTPVAVFSAHVEGQVAEQILSFVTLESVALDASGKPKLVGDLLVPGKKIAANVYARLRAGRTDVAPVLWAAKLAQSEEF